jgi:hypothetical protein
MNEQAYTPRQYVEKLLHYVCIYMPIYRHYNIHIDLQWPDNTDYNHNTIRIPIGILES